MQRTGYFATIYRFGVLICGPKNRVFDIKSGHDFCRYRNSIQVIYFQISGSIDKQGLVGHIAIKRRQISHGDKNISISTLTSARA